MKRFISTLCLLVGASVASYAGVITSTSGTNLLGANSALQNFDNSSVFPLGAFTSLPTFNLTGGTTNVNVTVSTSSTIAAGDPNTRNTGGTGSIATGSGSAYGPGLDGNYLSTYSQSNILSPTGFARNLTLTFAGAVSEFLIDYFSNDSTLNYFTINGLSTRYALANESCIGTACLTSGRSIGYVADATIPAINTVTFTFIGQDQNLANGDIVLFDDLRIVGSTSTGSTGSNGTGSTGSTGTGGGEVPEPSTYALMGAGLMALAYARRKR